jgi:hypothetical protein
MGEGIDKMQPVDTWDDFPISKEQESAARNNVAALHARDHGLRAQRDNEKKFPDLYDFSETDQSLRADTTT